MSVVEHCIRITTELTDIFQNQIPDSLSYSITQQEKGYLINLCSPLTQYELILETIKTLSKIDGVSLVRYVVISIDKNIYNVFEYISGVCVLQEISEYFTKYRIECEKCGQNDAIMYDDELRQSICSQCEEVVLYERFGT